MASADSVTQMQLAHLWKAAQTLADRRDSVINHQLLHSNNGGTANLPSNFPIAGRGGVQGGQQLPSSTNTSAASPVPRTRRGARRRWDPAQKHYSVSASRSAFDPADSSTSSTTRGGSGERLADSRDSLDQQSSTGIDIMDHSSDEEDDDINGTGLGSGAGGGGNKSSCCCSCFQRLLALVMPADTKPEFSQLLILILFRLISLTRWMRKLWSTWSMLVTCMAAYFLPRLTYLNTLSQSPLVTSVVVGSIFLTTGLGLPVDDFMQGLRRMKRLYFFSSLIQFVIMPMLALIVPVVCSFLFVNSSKALSSSSSVWSRHPDPTGVMRVGLLCAGSLPPGALIPIVMAKAAGGSEPVARAAIVVSNLVGLVLTPVMVLALTPVVTKDSGWSQSLSAGGSGVVQRDGQTVLSLCVVTMLLPLVLGIILQLVIGKRQRCCAVTPRSTPNSKSLCSEYCEPESTTNSGWRGAARHLGLALSLLLNYMIFCSLFTALDEQSAATTATASPSTSSSTTTESPSMAASFSEFFATTSLPQKLMVTGFVLLPPLLMTIGGGLIAWFGFDMLLSGQGKSSVERLAQPFVADDRIALFFAATQKSELLAVPLVIQLFMSVHDANSSNGGSGGHVGTLLWPALVFHLVQSITGSIALFPIRRWRNRQHCRPGTSLLTARSLKVPKYQLELTSALTSGLAQAAAAATAALGGPAATAETPNHSTSAANDKKHTPVNSISFDPRNRQSPLMAAAVDDDDDDDQEEDDHEEHVRKHPRKKLPPGAKPLVVSSSSFSHRQQHHDDQHQQQDPAVRHRVVQMDSLQ